MNSVVGLSAGLDPGMSGEHGLHRDRRWEVKIMAALQLGPGGFRNGGGGLGSGPARERCRLRQFELWDEV